MIRRRGWLRENNRLDAWGSTVECAQVTPGKFMLTTEFRIATYNTLIWHCHDLSTPVGSEHAMEVLQDHVNKMTMFAEALGNGQIDVPRIDFHGKFNNSSAGIECREVHNGYRIILDDCSFRVHMHIPSKKDYLEVRSEIATAIATHIEDVWEEWRKCI